MPKIFLEFPLCCGQCHLSSGHSVTDPGSPGAHNKALVCHRLKHLKNILSVLGFLATM